MKQLFFGLCFLLASMWVTSIAEDAWQWHQWRGPERTSTLPEGSLPERLGDSLQLVWQQSELQPSYSGPVVWNDLVYTTETIDRRDEQVTAFRLADGQPKWKVAWESSLAVPFFAAANGDWIRATPAVVEDSLVVSSMRDIVVCLDPQSGKERWRADFADRIGSQQPAFGNVCSPLIDDGAVYVQAGQAVTKLELASGDIIWQAMKNDSGMASSGAFSSPVIQEIAGQRQLVVQTRETLAGLRLSDGEVLWQQPIEAFRGMNILTPLVDESTVFTSTYGGKSQLYRVDATTDGQFSCDLVWENKAQGYMSSPVQIGQYIFLHLKNQRIICINKENGKETWTSTPMGKYQSMITDGQRIAALDQTGELILLEANPTELTIVDRQQVAKDSWAHLAISGRYLIVRDLHALKVFRF